MSLEPGWTSLASELAPTAPGVRSELARYLEVVPEGTIAPWSIHAYDRGLTLVRTLAGVAPAPVAVLAQGLPAAGSWPRVIRAVLRMVLEEVGAGLVDLEEALAATPADDPVRIPALSALGRGYAQLGDVTRAAQAFHEGAELARAAGDTLLEGRMVASLGFLHGEHDDPVPYEEATRRALELIRLHGDRRLIAHGLCNLAGALARQGRNAEARAALEEGWPLARDLDWTWGQALYLAGFGGVLANVGKLDEGLAAYRRSLELLAELGDEFQRTRHLFTMARHLVEYGRHAEAVAVLGECVASCRAHAFSATLSLALDQLSLAREGLGDAPGALAALREHVRVAHAAASAQVADRVRLAELRFEAQAQRAAAAAEHRRVEALRAVNAELAASLSAQAVLQGRLRELAETDPLTQLPNRRHHEAELRRLEGQAEWSVALLDVDHFKAINDAHGHAVGDEVLVELARRLEAWLRGSDQVARWGGEEFCLTMPGAGAAAAERVAARLITAVSGAPFQTSAGAIPVSVSIGIATGGPAESHAELLGRADRALYGAKAAGRGQVVAFA